MGYKHFFDISPPVWRYSATEITHKKKPSVGATLVLAITSDTGFGDHCTPACPPVGIGVGTNFSRRGRPNLEGGEIQILHTVPKSRGGRAPPSNPCSHTPGGRTLGANNRKRGKLSVHNRFTNFDLPVHTGSQNIFCRCTPVHKIFFAGAYRCTKFFLPVHKVHKKLFCRFTLAETLLRKDSDSDWI